MADQEFRAQATPLHDQSAFAHTLNKNGLHDTICLKCFRVVDSQREEADLVLAEQMHACEMFHLTVTPTVLEVLGEVKSDLDPRPDPDAAEEP